MKKLTRRQKKRRAWKEARRQFKKIKKNKTVPFDLMINPARERRK